MTRTKRCVLVLIAALACVWSARAAAYAVEAQTGGAAACALAPDPGPCKGLFEKFYFDAKSGTCRSFFYGGCQGVVPFETIEECRAACEQTGALRLSYRISERPGPAMFVDVLYPNGWDEPEISLTVNGAPATARRAGGGFDTESQFASFLLAPGAAGNKEIVAKAAAGDKSGEARTAVFWNPDPLIALLDTGGLNQAVLEPGALRILAWQAQNVSASFNGAPLELKAERQDAALGDILAASPAWQQGLNTLSVKARAMNGGEIAEEFTFVNMAKGQLALHHTASLVYGEVGSKSGPFYRIETDGDALSLQDDNFGEIFALDDEGWLFPKQVLTVTLAPQAPGKSTLRIYKKEHFTQGETLLREIPVTVAGK